MSLTKVILLVTIIFWTGCSRVLYFPEKKLLDIRNIKGVRPPEEVLFHSSDGTALHGWYFRNKLYKRPRARIVFFHGNAENISTHFASLHWILDHGYDYFIFDYRGYGRSEGRPSPRGTVEDGIAALCWAFKKKPFVPVVVFGQSLGGAVALRTVIEVKNFLPVSMVVVESTFSSYRSAARSVMGKNWFTSPLQPIAYLVLSDRYAPKNRIREIAPIPLLVFHGREDRTVRFHLGKEVFDLAGEPKVFVEVPEGRHIDSFRQHDGKYRKILLVFLKLTKKGW